jgi:hypothetical protein
MRDPGTAAVDVVLDDDQPAARGENVANRCQDRPPLADEVQAVRREDAVERAGRQRAGEVNDFDPGRRPREGRSDTLAGGLERAAVAIEGDDLAARAQDVGEGERERPLPCPELQPMRPCTLDTAPNQGGVIVVVHGAIMPTIAEIGR